MFIALNTMLRRQRRRLAVVVVLCGLAGAVVTAHSAMGADHMDHGVAMCLAIVETALVAVSAVLLVGAARHARPAWALPRPACPPPSPPVRRVDPVARAGPPIYLGVLRL